MNDMAKNLILWLIIAIVLFSVFNNFNVQPTALRLDYSQFVEEVDRGNVRRAIVGDHLISGERTNGEKFEVVIPTIPDLGLMGDLLEHNVVIEGREPERQSLWMQLFVAAFPILLILAIFIFFMRQMQGGMGGGGRGGPMSFGKSKARLLSEDQIKTTFSDVAGVDEAKDDVSELVEFLRDPGKFQKLGGKIPRGVLMVGPPGTGKTLLAKAIAGEAKVPFFSISGSDFVEMFVGVGASRVRDMFEQAKKQSPCIIFIDEIDAVGRSRGAGLGGGHDEREQTLNQLLVEMDGFEENDGVIVIAATNRPDVLDAALLRPGRFDRQVTVSLPDVRGREQILKVHMRNVSVADDVNPSIIARGTPGFSGADLANLVNEATLLCARANQRLVSMEWFDKAKDKIMMGAERKNMVMSDFEKSNTAYHEAGHAIVGRLVPEHDPVYKVSIIPRGRALGVTMFLPTQDRYSLSKRHIESQICSLYGGRIAEEMTLGFDGVTTGASNDIQRATELARNMITKWGLSEKLGPLAYGEEEGEVFLGKSMTQTKNISGETAHAIDVEVRAITDDCYQRAKVILEENKDKLEVMAKALIQFETIDIKQIDEIMNGKTPSPPDGWDGGGSNGSAGGGGSEQTLASAPADEVSSDEGHQDKIVGKPSGA